MKGSDIMTHKVISIEPEASIMQGVHLMLQHRISGISGLPVVDAKGVLVGVLCDGDLLRRQETGTQKRRARWVEFLMGSGRAARVSGEGVVMRLRSSKSEG
jgi:CBS domain-containing protein